MASKDISTLKVALLSGGWSDEREVALTSGRACAEALAEAGFENVDFIDVAEPGFASKLEQGGYDVAFIAMHGIYGEDGCIQGMLECLKIPYTFSHVRSSAASMDKNLAKLVYSSWDIPTPDGYEIDPDTVVTDEDIEEMADELGFPMFVKPVSNGSSFGITRVTSIEAIRPAIEEARKDGGVVLVEECIEGVEITIPVIGNEDAQALPAVEIVTGAEFYDSKVKYEPSELHHVIPARLPEDVYAAAQEYAVLAHKALGCSGVSRTDFIVTEDGTPVALETNTIPGMTPTSLLPDSARHAGISFPELCKRFVELALESFEGDVRS